MNKADVLKQVAINLGGNQRELVEEFSKFAAENNDLDDAAFYAKFKNQFTWIEFTQQSNRAYNLRIIANMLIFFTVITVLGLLVALATVLSGGNA